MFDKTSVNRELNNETHIALVVLVSCFQAKLNSVNHEAGFAGQEQILVRHHGILQAS